MSGYDFLLVTVLVKDEYGVGVPVAWLISSREDICALDLFFAAFKLQVGNVEVNNFMSDDADAFYNAKVCYPRMISSLCQMTLSMPWEVQECL